MTTPQTLGFQEAGSGPLLLLVHGFPFDSAMWSGQLAGLAESRRVVAVDLRGRGRSSALTGEPWSLQTHADDLARLVDSLGVPRADFAGHSMGGYILFELWRRHPQKVRSLMFVGTKAQDDPPAVRQSRQQTAALVRAQGTAVLFDQMAPRLLAPRTGEAVREQLRQMFERTPGETAARDSLAMAERPDSTPLLPTLTVPALVLHGTEDPIVPVDAAARMAGQIPQVVFAPIPEAGHLPPLEQPELTNKAMREFLAGIRR